MNQAFCNTCSQLVPATREEREGQVFLVKHCRKCGSTETLISSDATRYSRKRLLDSNRQSGSCRMNCLTCNHGKTPNLVFIDVTNRCNLNCPICINNTPSMGFTFDPPIEYFERIFDYLASLNPKPSIQLFGGEPTVRHDLIRLVHIARRRRLPTRVVTNGVKLADEAYCRELVGQRATIMLAYDGSNPETYRTLRASERSLQAKQKALENLSRINGAKVTLMTLVARNFNERELPELFNLCHHYRNTVRAIYLMPLAHTWDPENFNPNVGRITLEDVESIMGDTFPSDAIEFLPAGFLGQIGNLLRILKIKPLPFGSAHPNCESMYLMVSNGQQYLPISRYLKSSMVDIAKDLDLLDQRFSGRPRSISSFISVFFGLLGLARRHMDIRQCLKGKSGLAKSLHLLGILSGLLIGRRLSKLMIRHSYIQDALQVIVLPFEDRENLETERMERCPTAFAYFDPVQEHVRFVPSCAWSIYKTDVMRGITEYYREHPVPPPAAVEEMAAANVS